MYVYWCTTTCGFEYECSVEICDKIVNDHTHVIYDGGVLVHTSYLVDISAWRTLRSVEKVLAFMGACDSVHEFEKWMESDDCRWLDALRIVNTSLEQQVTFRCTGVRGCRRKCGVSSQELSAGIGGVVLKMMKNWQAKMKDYDHEVLFHVCRNDGDDTVPCKLLLGLVVVKDLHLRHTALNVMSKTLPVNAFVMLMMAGIRDHRKFVVLEPMCGVGTIVFEGCEVFRECQFIGVELSGSTIAVAKRHAESCGLSEERVRLYEGDATNLKKRLQSGTVDAIVCDMPFGRRHGSPQKNESLYPKCLNEWARVAKSGALCVVLTECGELLKKSACSIDQSACSTPLWEVKACVVPVVLGRRKSGVQVGVYVLARTNATHSPLPLSRRTRKRLQQQRLSAKRKRQNEPSDHQVHHF